MFDLRDAVDPTGETTEGREDVLVSAGACLEDVDDVNDDNKVEVRDLGVGGAPVADGALGGSMDDLLLGGGGPEGGVLDEAIVVVFAGGFAEDVLGVFFTAEGAAEVDLERVEEAVVVAALLGGAAFAAPLPNVPEFRT